LCIIFQNIIAARELIIILTMEAISELKPINHGTTKELKKTRASRSFQIDSDILSFGMKRLLLDMILGEDGEAEGTVSATLVHAKDSRASAATFEAAVRHTTEVLVIVERGNGFLFGAFICDDDDTRMRTGHHMSLMGVPTQSFLFSLGGGQYSRIGPLKLLASESRARNGLHLGTDFMPFCIRPVCMPNQYRTVASGYSLPLGQRLQNGTLCGTPGTAGYTARRTEVFSLVISPHE
jgi:hypothetical protein